MSSAAGKGQSAQTAETKPQPVLLPVSTLDTAAAKAASLAQPVVLIGLLAAGFGELVRDPISALQSAFPVVAAVQVVYVILSLPPAGSAPSRGSKSAKKTRPGDKKKTDATAPNLVLTTILSFILTAIATPAIHILFILFGAPFLDHAAHTFLCAAHLALLALFPIFYARGVDGQAMIAAAGAYAPLDETFGGLVGAVLGGWLGAVPIPLDWDRDWQQWPITIVTGIYFGYVLGSKAGGSLFHGKRLVSSTPDTTDEE